MTLRDEIPVHRCAVKACPMLGRWPEGGRCPEHRADIYDGSVARPEIEVTDAPQD